MGAACRDWSAVSVGTQSLVSPPEAGPQAHDCTLIARDAPLSRVGADGRLRSGCGAAAERLRCGMRCGREARPRSPILRRSTPRWVRSRDGGMVRVGAPGAAAEADALKAAVRELAIGGDP